MTAPLTSYRDFEHANPLYAGAVVTFLAVSNGVVTTALVPLYTDQTGEALLANPQTLDSEGKTKQPIYFDQSMIARVTGLSVGSHDSGIITPAPVFRIEPVTQFLQYSWDGGITWEDAGFRFFKDRGDWAASTLYLVTDIVKNLGTLYFTHTEHTSAGAFDATKFTAVFVLDMGQLPSGTQFQLRRGTTAQHAVFTGTVGEVTVDTTKKTLVVHDAVTAGGLPVARTSGETFTGTLTMLGAVVNEEKGSDISADVTTNIGAATGNYVVVTHATGALSVTSLGTIAKGARREVRFSVTGGTLTLAHSAAIDLPGASNIVVAHGDRMTAISEGSGNWTVTDYYRASGVPLVSSSQQSITVRQTVRLAKVDASGYAAFLAAGTGLAVDLDAAPTPLIIDFASGETDLTARISNDESPFVSGLAAENTSFLFGTFASATSITKSHTLIPPQYGYAFARTKQSLLRFVGADGGTTILDDYGNTWTAAGNAQLDTAVQVDGLNTLLLDGTGDYAESTSFVTSIDGSWQVEVKVRFNALPSAAQVYVLELANTAGFGVILGLDDTAGTKKLTVYLSSNGTTHDIASNSLGTSTSWATATTYHLAVGYDAIAGKYFVYKDGVQDISITSASRVCKPDFFRLGADGSFASPSGTMNGALAGFRFSSCCRYPNGTTFTPPNISTFAVEGHFFSIPEMKMYEVTGASAAAGTNPTMTSRSRIFLGEADTNASAVTAVRNYALRGRYEKRGSVIAASQVQDFQHNIGVPPRLLLKFVNLTPDQAYVPGDEIDAFPNYFDGTSNRQWGATTDRNLAKSLVGSGATAGITKVAGGPTAFDSARWAVKLIAERAF